MKFVFISLSIICIVITGCGSEKQQTPVNRAPTAEQDILSAEEIKKGVGPIKSIQLNEINPVLAEEGSELFSVKCVACHKFDSRLVGPPLNGITERRTPEFIMNMILNPDEMVKKHPEVKEMLATYFVPMTFQNVSEKDARALLEYLRAQDTVKVQ